MRTWPIYLTNFFLTSALGVVFVFLEDVQTDRRLADWEVGAIASAGFGVALVAQLAFSPLADRGRTRSLAAVAILAGVVGPIGFAYGQTVLILALSRGLSGVGLGLFQLLARKALLGLDASGGGAKLGTLLSTAVGGFIVGPLIGAALEPFGFEAPFLAVSAAIAVVGVPATVTILGTEIAAAPVDYSDLGRLIRRPRVQSAMLVSIVVMGFIGVFDSIIDRFLTDLGAGTGMVAVVILFVGGPLLVLPRLAGNLAERRGGSQIMLFALPVLIAAQLGYGFGGVVVAVTIAGFVHGSAESFAAVSAQVLVLEVTGAERAAVGSALLDTAGLVSATVTSAVAPALYGQVGQQLFLWSAAVGSMLSLAALLRVRQARIEEFVAAA